MRYLYIGFMASLGFIIAQALVMGVVLLCCGGAIAQIVSNLSSAVN